MLKHQLVMNDLFDDVILGVPHSCGYLPQPCRIPDSAGFIGESA